MTFTKAEKEIIRAIVKYGGEAGSLADAINRSRILEKRGWNILVDEGNSYYLFFREDRYTYDDEQKVKGYLAEMLALLNKLYNERLLIAFPSSGNRPLVIGKENVKIYGPNLHVVDFGKERIIPSGMFMGWFDMKNKSLYNYTKCTEMVLPLQKQLFSAYHVSQDLRELVKNDFKSEEEIRFEKQQCLTWISIAAAIALGLLGIFYR